VVRQPTPAQIVVSWKNSRQFAVFFLLPDDPDDHINRGRLFHGGPHHIQHRIGGMGFYVSSSSNIVTLAKLPLRALRALAHPPRSVHQASRAHRPDVATAQREAQMPHAG
jgi:hypothetical protein